GAALAGEKFHHLLAAHARNVRVITRPCAGWVELVERGEVSGAQAQSLVEREVSPLLAQGADVLVLGCTHYPFLRPLVERAAGPAVTVLDTGAAVARHTRRVLEREQLRSMQARNGSIEWHTSGDARQFASLRERLLQV
ncbi:MAG TPA: aspartate/glutamate racemase family protein, partial [Nevskiaceae bacterium]|nr:aspartate/glutamate racemase family protein [Nevskiaceae bacterium]